MVCFEAQDMPNQLNGYPGSKKCTRDSSRVQLFLCSCNQGHQLFSPDPCPVLRLPSHQFRISKKLWYKINISYAKGRMACARLSIVH